MNVAVLSIAYLFFIDSIFVDKRMLFVVLFLCAIVFWLSFLMKVSFKLSRQDIAKTIITEVLWGLILGNAFIVSLVLLLQMTACF
jgi:hypothetical protein